MSRRIPSIRTLPWIALVVLVGAAVSTTIATAPALASEGDDGQELIQQRPVIEDPEVGLPGDDDQPTITRRKRDPIIATQPAPPSGDAGSSSNHPVLRERWTRGVEALRVFVRRSWLMLR